MSFGLSEGQINHALMLCFCALLQAVKICQDTEVQAALDLMILM